jgi:hypothetical protein
MQKRVERAVGTAAPPLQDVVAALDHDALPVVDPAIAA